MNRLVSLAAVAVAIALPVRAQEGEPLEKKIDRAITKGVDWLKKQQKSDGSFPDSGGQTYGPGIPANYRTGNSALSLLALLKSDVDPSDPVIVKGFEFLLGYLQQKNIPRSTYEVGVALMALEALYEARVAAKMKKEGRKVTERAGDFKEPRYGLSPKDAAVASALVKELVEAQAKSGGWRYGKSVGADAGDEDISSTQIVLLGLKSATRMRVPVDSGIFHKTLPYVLDAQEKDGPKVERPRDFTPKPGDRGTFVGGEKDRARGWAYMLKSKVPTETQVTGGMTCAGITSLLIIKSVIGRSLAKPLNDKVEQAVYDGFAWMQTHWDVSSNPSSGRSHLYYLYGLERIGTLGCFERIASHAWFREGAEQLVSIEQDDGSWTDTEVGAKELYATCFALLFLKRGTVPIGDVMTGGRK